MHEPGLEARLSEGQLHRPMVDTGAFDGHDEILQVVLTHGLAKPVDGGPEVAAIMGQSRRFE